MRRDFRQTEVTTYASERYSLDGMGNQGQTWKIGFGLGTETDDSLGSLRVYQYHTTGANRGRLSHYSHPPVGQDDNIDQDFLAHDAAGNVVGRSGDRSIASGVLRNASGAFYDNEGRLRVFNRLSCLLVLPAGTSCNYASSTPLYSTSAHETYWYDGLGRRVLLRTRKDSTCTSAGRSECGSFIERTVWDGDHPLYEIRYPGGDEITPTELEQDTGFVAGPQFNYGRVAYTNGTSIDDPLGIVRVGYNSIWQEAVAIMPHASILGVYDFGSFADGKAKKCQSYGPDTNCVLLDWPGRVLGQSVYFGPSEYNIQLSWQGHQIGQRRDLSGQMYLRNRFYDPVTGRFTQQDPIGLAGGLNLYGFANSDPVSFSDPFGLCPYFLTGRPCSFGQAVGIGFVPVIGDAIEIAGALAGKDQLTGDRIDGVGVGLTIAGTIFGSGKLAREAAEAASKYVNITRKGSRVWNRATDVGAAEFGEQLMSSGFGRTTRADGLEVFTRGDRRYVVRGPERSNSGWTADVYLGDEMVGKIRLGR